MRLNQHNNDVGRWCLWSGTDVDEAYVAKWGTRCPVECADSDVEAMPKA